MESTSVNTSSSVPLAAWLKQHYRLVWSAVFVLCAMPALQLFLAYQNDALGANPLQTLEQSSGRWALILLIITLCITPARRLASKYCQRIQARYGKRLADWNWIIRLRRMLGMYSFAYATLHLGIWLEFDQGYDWSGVAMELGEKPYLAIGALSLLLLIPLAATSTNAAMRLLGKNWRRLHRLVYPIAILGVMHLWMSLKPGSSDAWPYALAVALLLGYRVLASHGWMLTRPRDDGMEVTERIKPASRNPAG